jgi:hypothetical protein
MNGIPGVPAKRDGAELLARTAELGEYFALPAIAGGHEIGTLLDDRAAVVELVDRTRSAIAASRHCDPGRVPARMAASSFQLGLVARLLSPVIGAAVALGEVPLLTARSVRWQPTQDHVPKFGTSELEWVPASTPRRAAEVISASLLSTVVAPLNDTIRSTVSLSTHITWGNAISAANGAVTVMSVSRRELEGPGRALVMALLDTEHLRRTGDYVRGAFVRRSCCLFYQAPQSGFCQDCLLTVSDGSQSTAPG